MWGDSSGLRSYRYKYASGREADWPLVGFSPCKQNLTVYIMSGFEQYDQLLQRLAKYSTAKSCLYIKRLADVDLAPLQELIKLSVEHMVSTNSTDMGKLSNK